MIQAERDRRKRSDLHASNYQIVDKQFWQMSGQEVHRAWGSLLLHQCKDLCHLPSYKYFLERQ